jgi:hypothetical protein
MVRAERNWYAYNDPVTAAPFDGIATAEDAFEATVIFSEDGFLRDVHATPHGMLTSRMVTWRFEPPPICTHVQAWVESAVAPLPAQRSLIALQRSSSPAASWRSSI